MRKLLWCTAFGLGIACTPSNGGPYDGGETGGTSPSDASGTADVADGTDQTSGTFGGDGSSEDSSESGESGEPPVVCDPTAGGPVWAMEGEPLEVAVQCATGLSHSGADFAIDNLPTGAVYDPADATIRWTPGLDQGAVYVLGVESVLHDEWGELKIGVADAFEDPENVPVVDPALYTEEYGLPVLFLETSPELTNVTYSPATITAGGHAYIAQAKLRGASSLGYPKNNYTLKFAKEDKFSDPVAAGGFNEKRKMVLTSTFDDNTYVRQRLSYEVWNRLDADQLQIQTYNGIVFLDGEYHGLYLFSDHVDEFLMEDHGLAQAGNLYKARTHDANFRLMRHDGDPKSTLHDGLSKAEGLPAEGEPGAFDDLEELVDFVSTAPSKTFVAELDSRIDRRDYENWWIAVSAIEAGDSAGKNSYQYHDPNGGRWRVAPWDFNHSFGQNWRTIRIAPDGWPESYAGRNELFTRLLDEPTFGPPLRARYGEVLNQQLALVDLLDLVELWTTENYPSALRDQTKWGQQYLNYPGWASRTDFLDHDGEVEYLRQWMVDRWAYLQDQY